MRKDAICPMCNWYLMYHLFDIGFVHHLYADPHEVNLFHYAWIQITKNRKIKKKNTGRGKERERENEKNESTCIRARGEQKEQKLFLCCHVHETCLCVGKFMCGIASKCHSLCICIVCMCVCVHDAEHVFCFRVFCFLFQTKFKSCKKFTNRFAPECLFIVFYSKCAKKEGLQQ